MATDRTPSRIGIIGGRKGQLSQMARHETYLLGALVFVGALAAHSMAAAQQNPGPTTGVPAECEKLVDPIQRAKCVEEKSKGKK